MPLLPAPSRARDCTCDGHHTQAAPGLDASDLKFLMSEPGICHAEKRALARILMRRVCHL